MSKSSSLSHRVTNDIRRDIIAGILPPGAWLKTEELGTRYAVSANPVREALWRLQGEGYVVANPNQGARVRMVDDDFVRNVFEVREAIEPVFVARFCHRVTAEDLAQLREAANAFAEVAERAPNDFEALDNANRVFHAIILKGESNIQAIEVIERYAGLINATRAKLPITPVRLRQRVAQHFELIAAIEAGDPDAAAKIAAAHVRAAGDDMLTQMRQVRMSQARAAKHSELGSPRFPGATVSN